MSPRGKKQRSRGPSWGEFAICSHDLKLAVTEAFAGANGNLLRNLKFETMLSWPLLGLHQICFDPCSAGFSPIICSACSFYLCARATRPKDQSGYDPVATSIDEDLFRCTRTFSQFQYTLRVLGRLDNHGLAFLSPSARRSSSPQTCASRHFDLRDRSRPGLSQRHIRHWLPQCRSSCRIMWTGIQA